MPQTKHPLQAVKLHPGEEKLTTPLPCSPIMAGHGTPVLSKFTEQATLNFVHPLASLCFETETWTRIMFSKPIPLVLRNQGTVGALSSCMYAQHIGEL
jgi:hypothetical protein